VAAHTLRTKSYLKLESTDSLILMTLVLSTDQKVSFKYLGTNFIFTVESVLMDGQVEEGSLGVLVDDTV
jgi:hypothetical protein